MYAVSRVRQKFLSHSALLLLLFSSQCFSARVTIDGSLYNSDFDLTYEDTDTGLFGVPSLSNNVIFFTPTGFSATSSNGAGAGFINSAIHLTLTPHEGRGFDAFELTERGDYILEGSGAGVKVYGQIRARSIDNVLAESSVFVRTPEPLNQQGINNWEAGALIDENAGDWLPSNTGVIFSIENILYAKTKYLNELAFIEKKFTAVDVKVVPLPAALPLLLSGLLLLRLIFARHR